MFIKEKDKIKAVTKDGKTFSGDVYKIVIDNNTENNEISTIIFISQDKCYIAQEGDFGCVTLDVKDITHIQIY